MNRVAATSATEPVDPAVSEASTVPFGDFYRAEWPGTVRLAALLTQQSTGAEDLAQDAFARVYVKWERAINPKAYLRATLVNVCRQWQRGKGRERSKFPLIATLDSVDFVARELADAVASLPYCQRAVLVLRYYADYSEAEIAQALDCRPGTVKSLASRALARLGKDIHR